MTIVSRYVLIETLKTFLVASTVILTCLLVVGGVQQGIKNGLPPRVIVEILPYLVPEMLRFALPGCLLFAVCSVFGRMSAANEILAVKAAGVNPSRMIWPVILLAGILSLFTFTMYDLCAIWARPGLKRTMIVKTDEIIYSYLRSNKSFANSRMSIAVKDVENGDLIQPVIHIFEDDTEKKSVTFSAERASLFCSEEDNTLRFTCYHGWVEVGEEASFSFKGLWTNDLELPSSERKDVDASSPAELLVSEISHQVRREKSLLRDLAQQTPVAGSIEEADQAEELANKKHGRRKRLYRLQAETPRRLANGLACLCFAMVGIPVAIWQKSSDNIGVFFLCFGPILLVYYPLLVVGENLARDGVFPGLSVWLADGVLIAAGALLMRWQMRS